METREVEPGDDLSGLRLPQEVPRSRSRSWLWLFLACVLAIGAFVSWKMLGSGPLTVTTAEIVAGARESGVKLTAIGYVQPKKRALVAAKSAARVAKMHVSEGQMVNEGDLLAVLESDDATASVAEAQAALATAKAGVRGKGAALRDAKLQLNREQSLFKSGSVGKATVDAAQSRVSIAAAGLAAANAEVLSAQARLERAKVGLASTRVVAPIRGKVLRRFVSEGEMVSSANAALVEIADFSSLHVEADVSERKIGELHGADPAVITLDAFAGKRFRGEIEEMQSAVDRQKATISVRVKFLDDTAGVLPQMAAKVAFVSRALTAAELDRPPPPNVPVAAVAQRGTEKVVFVVENGRVRKVPISVGETDRDGNAEITLGPPIGTRVVLNPPETLTDGAAVKE